MFNISDSGLEPPFEIVGVCREIAIEASPASIVPLLSMSPRLNPTLNVTDLKRRVK